MTCANLQDLDRFPIILVRYAYPDGKFKEDFCDANDAAVYIGDNGRHGYHGKGWIEPTDRHTFCSTNSTIDGTSISCANLEMSKGALGCVSGICNGVLKYATVNSELGGIGVCYHN